MAEGKMPIGVFVNPREGLDDALDKVVGLGLQTAQLQAPGPGDRTSTRAGEVARAFLEAGVDISLVFCGFPGESYESIPIVRQTVGLVPHSMRSVRVEIAMQIADFASWLGAPGIGIHVGFVSENWDSADFASAVVTVRELADHCAGRGISMNLETGQETADTLLQLIRTVDRPNLHVNFDPANMIMYGSGEPLEALRKVGGHVKSCHCKDATRSNQPGREWGVEAPLGQGDVDIEQFVATLAELDYEGPLTIEREISGEKQIADIKAGVELLRDIKGRLGIE